MKQYKGHPVIEMSEARLVPPNQNYPDCRCFMVLTERCFFVLEDNYNDTYTEHFLIPLNQISNMNVLVSGEVDNDSHLSESTGFSAAASVATAVLGLLGGMIVLPGGNKKQAKHKYMRIDYLDEWAHKQEVFFTELGSDAKKMVKYWQASQQRD